VPNILHRLSIDAPPERVHADQPGKRSGWAGRRLPTGPGQNTLGWRGGSAGPGADRDSHSCPVGIRPGFRGGLSRQGRDAHAKVSEQGGASPEVTARLGRRAVRIDAGAARARALAMS
jgi:hypothetical protein